MSSYYIAKAGSKTGPYEESEIRRQIEEGTLTSDDLCWSEDMGDWQPVGRVFALGTEKPSPPPIPPTAVPGSDRSAPLFLYIPVSRLIILSIVSMSLYEIYWIYKNWRYIKERDNLNIHPFWRGVFGIFFCHSLLRRIHEDEESRSVQMPSFSPGGLATGWVVLVIIANIISRAPGITASIISALVPSFLCLVPIQRYINAVSERRNPGQPYYGWSSGHVVCLVIGLLIWGLAVLSMGAV